MGLECQAYVYRGAPVEYKKPLIVDTGWIPMPSFKPPFRSAPAIFILCQWFRIIDTAKYLRELVTVTVVCTCPDQVLSITEWNKFTYFERDIQFREPRIRFGERCPTHPDALFP